MTAGEWDLPAMRTLAVMPFLDRLELAAITGMSEGTAHYVLGRLRGAGLAGSIRHAAPLTPSSRRWRLTAEGLGRLAMEEGVSVDRLLRTRPVSARWQRLLLARLDAVAVIYRLASAVAGAAGPPGFRWYRSAVLDAAMTLPGGKTLGVIRQGATTDRTGFSHRVRWLPDPSRPLPGGGPLPRTPWRTAARRAAADPACAAPGNRHPRRTGRGSRLPAAGRAQAGGKAGIGPPVRVALDYPHRSGRLDGTLALRRLQADFPPGADRPGNRRKPVKEKTAGPEPPGHRASGPPGPGLRRHGGKAVER